MAFRSSRPDARADNRLMHVQESATVEALKVTNPAKRWSGGRSCATACSVFVSAVVVDYFEQTQQSGPTPSAIADTVAAIVEAKRRTAAMLQGRSREHRTIPEDPAG